MLSLISQDGSPIYKVFCTTNFVLRRWGGYVRSSSTRVITPVWAQQIEVERQDDALLITGWGHIPNPLSAQPVPKEKRPKLDILQRLRRYAVRHMGQSGENADVYQFADATDDEKLMAFAKQFGPVHGEVVECTPERTGHWTLTVKESLESLRHEQKQFALLVRIVQQVNRNEDADFETLARLLTSLEMDPAKSYDLVRQMAPKVMRGYFTTIFSTADLLPMVHQVLCIFFSHYQPKPFWVDQKVIQLPDVDFTGIRDALYFQLRLDYLAHREIATCLECGHHFPVVRRGTRGCSEACRRALRNARYWDKSKKAINAGRRGKAKKQPQKSNALGRKTSRVAALAGKGK
jgi:hypothetical protein